MKHAVAFLFALVVLCTSSAWSAAKMHELAVGQIWAIKNSPGPNTRIVIGRIEDNIVHISVFDVPTPPGYPLKKGAIPIGHMPFARAAIDMSIDKLLGSSGQTESSFEDGYKEWRSAKGGYFTISVSEAIAATLEAVTKGRQE